MKIRRRVATSLHSMFVVYRVRTGPGKPGKSWNFVVVFSRTAKSRKKTIGPGNSGNLFNSSKNYEMCGRQRQ